MIQHRSVEEIQSKRPLLVTKALPTEPLKGHVKYIYILLRSFEILLGSLAIILRSLEILFRSLKIHIAFPRNTFAFSRNIIQLQMKFYFINVILFRSLEISISYYCDNTIARERNTYFKGTK